MNDEGLDESPCDPETVRRLVKTYPKVLVVVESDNCAICHYYKKVVAEAEDAIGGEYATVEVQLQSGDEKCEAVARDLNIMGVPTVLVYENGVEKQRIHPTADFQKDVERLRSLK